VSKVKKLLLKLATGQFVELASRAREEIIRKQERKHHGANGDYFDEKNWKQICTAQFLDGHRQADQSVDLATALRSKSANKFFPGFDDVSEFGEYLAAHCPRERERILSTAEGILNGEFPVFHYGRVKLGDPPAWNLEARANVLAPERFYGDVDYLSASEVGDSKIVWEPSRMQFVYELGQSFLLTGKERYAAHFYDLINHWNRRNRDYRGINFCSALEFAFRANSVIWGVYFFQKSESLNQQAARDTYRLLYISGRFLADHLSRYFSPNTHLLGEAYGLFLIGTLFPEFREAEKWRSIGHKIMSQEMRRQINGDGMHAELSTCYHAYAVEFVLSFLILCERNGEDLTEDKRSVLRRMAEVLHHLQQPNGLWPHIGDEDGGRLYFLSRPMSHNYRPILHTTQKFLEIGNSESEQTPESFWLTGRNSAISQGSPSRYVLTILRSSGIVVARSKLMHAVLQAGPFGYRDCPHSHADHLHMDLSVNGEAMIVDPGTLCYTGDKNLRNFLRGSKSHNGPRLLDCEYYDGEDPFSWQAKPDCQVSDCYASKHASFFVAEYKLKFRDGLESEFCRQVLQLNDHGWMVNDRVITNRPHSIGWDFATPCAIEEHDEYFALVGKSNHLRIRCHPKLAEGEISEGIISNDYDSAGVGRRLRFVSAPVTGISETFTVLAFSHLDRSKSREEKGTSFGRIQDSVDGRTVYVESRMTEEEEGLFSDAAFGMILLYSNGEVHALLCRVSMLQVGRRMIFESEAELAFADVRLTGDTLTAAVPAGTVLRPAPGIKCDKIELKPLQPVNDVRNLRS